MVDNEKRKRDYFKLRRLSQSETISILLYLFIALLVAGRGVTLMQLTDEEIANSVMYSSLEQYLSMNAYGIVMIALSLILVIAVLIPSEPNFYVATFSNALIALVFVALGMSAWEHGSSVWNIYFNIVTAAMNGVLAAVGGYWLLWKRK